MPDVTNAQKVEIAEGNRYLMIPMAKKDAIVEGYNNKTIIKKVKFNINLVTWLLTIVFYN